MGNKCSCVSSSSPKTSKRGDHAKDKDRKWHNSAGTLDVQNSRDSNKLQHISDREQIDGMFYLVTHWCIAVFVL